MLLKTLLPLAAVASAVLAVPGVAPVAEIEERASYGNFCPTRPAAAAYQKTLFKQFIDTLYTNKNPIDAFNSGVDVNLIEHGPYDPQGLDALAAKLNTIIPYANFDVLRWSFDNNLGFVHIRINNNPPVSLMDLYRMNGTCIVEHWDVIQAKPADATNPIAMF